MAALNRLQQRIKENFQETTRDFSLLTGAAGPSTASYFDTSDEKLKEISKLLESRQEGERLEGMKRIIAGISKGRDMEGFFAQVVKNVVSPSIEIRKLVYIYLLRFASTNSDLLLLSINTFQKDLSDSSPLIRSMSLRVLTSIRVPVIQGIVMLGLKKLVNDRNPWVRKTVAGGLAKVYEMDASALPQLISLLQILLSSPSPLTLGASLTAFTEMCPDRLDLLHPYYRHICRMVMDADEWGQAVALDVLTRYARVMLEQPDESGPGKGDVALKVKVLNGEDSEDEFAGIDEDLAMLLHHVRPLFHSRNPAVVLGTAKLYYHLAPPAHPLVGQQLLVAPLLRLAGSAGRAEAGGQEAAALTWDVIASMAEERPWLFASDHSSFYLHESDTVTAKMTKLRAMIALVTAENADISLREFKHYVRFPEDPVAEEAVHALGYCIRTQPEVASKALSALMRLLKSRRDVLVAQSVIVLKSVILSQNASQSPSMPSPQRLVARLAKQLDDISNSQARASVFWLVGQFPSSEGEVKLPSGFGWEGLVSWVPDVLRKGVKGFMQESSIAKLQILTLATKLLVLSPATPQLFLMSQFLFSLARYDADYDVRDRGRFLHAILRGVRAEKKANETENGTDDEADEQDMSGVVLRRDQVKVVLLGRRETPDETAISAPGAELEIGTLSRITHKRLTGYSPLPEWTDDPTDSSLREAEVAQPRVPTPIPTPQKQSGVTRPPSSAGLSGSAHAAPPAAGLARSSTPKLSPAAFVPVNASAKGKFKDLDAFLNSDSESADETEAESETAFSSPRAVLAPPRSAIVPEYDDDTTEDEEDGDESDEEEERAPLYGRHH